MYRVEILVDDSWVDLSVHYSRGSALECAAHAARVVRSRSARVVSPEGYTTDVYCME